MKHDTRPTPQTQAIAAGIMARAHRHGHDITADEAIARAEDAQQSMAKLKTLFNEGDQR
jgi:hypothetical protein